MKRIILIATILIGCLFQSWSQNIADTLEISVCDNHLPYIYTKHNGLRIPLNSDGLHCVDTIGSDTIYVNLTVIKNETIYKYETLCQNKTILIDNNIIHGADYPLGDTILQYYVPSAYSCDTFRILYLTIVPTYNDTIEDKICLGEDYLLNGFYQIGNNKAGTFYYTDTLRTRSNGCDSIVTLKLTVNPHKDTTIYAGICEGETYTENEFNVSVQGTHTQNLTSAEGCDSTVILILSVYRAGENRTITAEICEGNIYRANGFYIDTTVGTHTITEDRVTKDSCKYTVTLYLNVLPNLKMGTPSVGEICGDDAYFPIKYNVATGKIDSIFVTFNEKALIAGFKNFVERNPSKDSIKIPLPKAIRPDNYSVTLYFDGRCSDTTFTVNFTVFYPSSVMEQRWNDVIVLKNAAYNGGYYFSDIQWLANGLPINPLFDKRTYIYTENITLQFGSEYRALLTRAGEYQNFCSCPLIPIQREDIYNFPRVESKMGKIKIYSNEPIVDLSLITILGQTLIRKQYANTEIEIDADAGMYILRLVTDKGQIHTQKIIVQQ